MAGFSSKNILAWAAALSVIGHAATLWLGAKLNLGAPNSTVPSKQGDGLVFVFDDAPPIQPLTPERDEADAAKPETPPEASETPEPPKLIAVTPPEPEPIPEPDTHIRPGIDKSSQDTPNWIGFADPTPHAARKATTAQPALDPKPAPPGDATEPQPPASESSPPAAPLVVEPVPATTRPADQPEAQPLSAAPPAEIAPAEQEPQPDALPETTDQKEGPKQDAIDDLHRKEGNLVEGDSIERPFVGPPEPTLADRAVTPEGAIASAAPAQPASRLAMAPAPRDATAPRPKPQTSTASAQTPPSPDPAPDRSSPSQPALGGGQPAEKSDQESDATSLDDALIVIPGRPAAAEGLEIVTKRPVFSRYVRTVASPDNPVYDVTFGRSGQVVKAVMLKSSGYPDVDDPVYNALLAWRAKGERLAQIGPGPHDGLTLTIQVVLR